MIRRLATVIGICLASAAAAQLPTPLPEIATEVTRAERYPPHEATFPNGVAGIPDLVYWNPLGYRPLTLDLYLPPSSMDRPAGGFPLVIHIHGGGWMSGDTHHSGPFVDFPGVLASLAAQGYVVAAIEYRLSSEARFPAQAQDVKAAIRWLRMNAAKYGIDPSRVVTWGESAGAHLAALAAVSCGASALEPTQSAAVPGPVAPPDVRSAATSDCVQGGVAWFGVFDMATIQRQAREAGALSRDNRDAPEWRLLGCFARACTPMQIAMASPITYVDHTDPPMLLIVGSDDTTVPTKQTLEMADKLKTMRVPHDVIVLPGINHSFLGKTLDQTRDVNLKALGATFRFFDETIGKRHQRPTAVRPVK